MFLVFPVLFAAAFDLLGVAMPLSWGFALERAKGIDPHDQLGRLGAAVR